MFHFRQKTKVNDPDETLNDISMLAIHLVLSWKSMQIGEL